MSIDTIVLRAMETKCTAKGQSFRMKHEFKMDGSICTEPHKDPALTVTRDTGGWIWCCHRCNENGYIGDKFVNPDSTLQKLDQIKETPVPKVTYIVKLPDDFVPLVDENLEQTKGIPFEAQSWLWKYNITDQDMADFGFGWSTRYQMVIMPLRSSDSRVLDGWIGRRIFSSDVLSEKGDYILDPMVGGGTTLIEAKLMARNALGIDITPQAIKLSKEALKFNHHPASKQKARLGDARDLSALKDNSIEKLDMSKFTTKFNEFNEFNEFNTEKCPFFTKKCPYLNKKCEECPYLNEKCEKSDKSAIEEKQ